MNAEQLKAARAEGYSDDEIRSYLISKGKELPDELKVSEAQVTGVQLPKYAKLGLTALQGPTLGFGEEITSAIGAPFAVKPGETLTEAYKRLRDIQRSAIKSYEEEYPIGAPVAKAISSLPLGMLRIGSGITGAAATGAATGAVTGAGEAPTIEEIPSEAALSAAAGGAMGGAVETARKMVAPAVSGAKARVVGMLPQKTQDFMNMSSSDYARRRIAQAMIRDGATTEQVSARLSKLGDDAVIAEAAGINTRDLLDTMATIPGRTKNMTEQLIRNRQATRGARLGVSAEENLAPGTLGLADTVEGLIQKRAIDASPLYDQVKKIPITIDKDLSEILDASKKLGAFSNAEKIATANRTPFSLTKPGEGVTASMTDLDLVKQGLDQLSKSSQAMSSKGEVTPFGAAILNLKNSLISKLDDQTIDKETGKSLYAAARSAYAGPSRMIDAAEFGRTVMNKTADQIRQEVRAMGQSELEAFRVGAYQSLSDMAGTRAGQSRLLNMWAEPATQEKLKEIFPSERAYRKFASDVAAESRKRELQSVGRGSQTAGREARMEDVGLEQLKDTANIAAASKTMDIGSLVNLLTSGMKRTIVPEPVRNEIGRILLSNAKSSDEIRMIREAMDRLKKQQQFTSTASGVIGGQTSQPFVDVLKSLL